MVLILIGGIVGCFMLFHKGEAIINDYTEETKADEDGKHMETDDEPEVVLSSNVIMSI